jgi:hypothetical protein
MGAKNEDVDEVDDEDDDEEEAVHRRSSISLSLSSTFS